MGPLSMADCNLKKDSFCLTFGQVMSQAIKCNLICPQQWLDSSQKN